MTATNTEADHISMRSGYWLATIGTKNVIDGATPLVLDAIDAMDLNASGAFCFADLGCADGGSSMALVRKSIEAVRAGNKSRQFQVIYTDQPGNDYNALFAIIHGLEKGPEPTFLDAHEGVFVSACGSSFYRQLLPDNSLDLGFSSTAMHWLSAKPCDISGHVQAVGASGCELAAFQRQARSDWETLLHHRAKELKPGGRLVLVNFCRDQQGRYLGHTEGADMFDTFNAVWQAMLAAGQITEDEYQRMTLPQYYNDVAEFSVPLMDGSSPVYRAGLRLESITTKVVECPYKLDFRQHGDAARFAENYIPTLRSWTQSTFMGGLNPQRDAGERATLIDRYYAAYAQRVLEEPEQHGMDYVHAYMVIRKE
ncbi:MAG: SAM-dependent methyltransferase [Gammaproteobacteria bacterium]|nr:SAM-dependent methyltransferase [Gammaproteobacteria bacterium]